MINAVMYIINWFPNVAQFNEEEEEEGVVYFLQKWVLS